jgi:tagatose 1,6-diphosphate aldolase GatY/KbaY
VRARLSDMTAAARAEGTALAAITCYDLTTATAVVAAAEDTGRPVILLVSPSTATHAAGRPLIRALRALADDSSAPVSIQLDHASNIDMIVAAVESGVDAVLADGSGSTEEANGDFVAAARAHTSGFPGLVIEAELGRIDGHEDIAGYAAQIAAGALTDPDRVVPFLERSGADLLAVSIGNVHGHYASEPHLDWPRLARLRAVTDVPLVLHGASGLRTDDLSRAISEGVSKINVNTELRQAVFDTLGHNLTPRRTAGLDLASLLDDWHAAVYAWACSVIGALANAGVSA